MGNSSRKILTLVEQSDNRNLFLRYWARNPIVWVLSTDTVKAVTTRLASAEILELTGPDAVTFAHSQFSSRVSTLANNDWQWSAWLDAQGRVQHFFALLRPSIDRLIVWQPRGSAEAMATSLRRYVMRAKLKIEVLGNWSLFDASEGGPAHDRLTESTDGLAFDLPGPRFRRALLSPVAIDTAISDDALNSWWLADIAAGLPWIATETAGQFVAATLDLQRLEATSLDKGCYPGQEIVARLHYRGGNKRHCYRLHIADGALPAPGDAILGDDSENSRGVILFSARDSSGGSQALGVLSDTLAQAGQLRLESNVSIRSFERAGTT